jgi:hypothetical protein
MHFATFAVARDAFYAAALLMGLALGFALRVLKTPEYRSVLVTGTLYLFSAALLAITIVLVMSQGAVVYDRGLVRAALCIMGLTVVCVFFPVPVGFPAVIATGILIVWAGVVFWRYPHEPNPQKTVQTAVRCGDLIPAIGGEVRYLDREPVNGLFFREEFAILSPAKNRLAFSFVSNREIASSL